MALISPTQMTLDFEPGLTDRFDTLLDCVRTGAFTNRNPLKTIAADMDMSQSDLSRKLSGSKDDPRRFSVEDLELYIEKTGDLNPVYYLIEKFLADEDARQRRAYSELSKQLPQLLALIKQASQTK